MKLRDEVAFYSGRRRGGPTFKTVRSILRATRADPSVTLLFTDDTRLKLGVDVDVDVKRRA